MDYDAMEGTSEVVGEVLDASSDDLTQQPQHLSLLSLNRLKKHSSCHLLSNGLSQSCHNIHELQWRFPRTDSAPSLPIRKTTAPVRDSGCIADTTDYDLPFGSTIMTIHPSQIDPINYHAMFLDEDFSHSTANDLLCKFK